VSVVVEVEAEPVVEPVPLIVADPAVPACPVGPLAPAAPVADPLVEPVADPLVVLCDWSTGVLEESLLRNMFWHPPRTTTRAIAVAERVNPFMSRSFR
jgi:hypothetical protein